MAFSITALFDPAVILGGTTGTGVLGFVAARFHKIEKEVRECRQRDADVKIIMAGVRVLVGKMQRDEPNSIELRMFQDLCSRRLGPPPTIEDFEKLLGQIDEADAQFKRRNPQ
jgi:hypothetical protein